MTSPRVSLLVAAHNHPRELRCTLLGLAAQTETAFETLLCDDGSDGMIADLVKEMRLRLPGGLRHLRQPHQGFRKCRILNAGLRRARGEYLVFLDADCVPHHAFIAAHYAARRPGHYLAGRRMELSPRLSETLTERGIARRQLGRLGWRGLPDALRGTLRHLEAGWRLPVSRPARHGIRLLGCNFSCWKTDLMAINGFDETFVTPGGGEDTDLERRLILTGLRSLSVKHQALCYHLYHPLVPRGPDGTERCRQRALEGQPRSPLGVDQAEGADIVEL